ncbi:MAG: hypothetical protein KGL39_41655 [Patescibacteria group bacterium]|nr:hypothetical protein [Patescibacteria group bacterium]
MMVADPRTEEAERLRRKIALAEMKGEADEPRTHRLRCELAEMTESATPDQEEDSRDEDIDDSPVVCGLPFSARINRRLQDRGVFEVDDLATWTYRLLGKVMRWQDVLAVQSVLGAMGLLVVGTADELLSELPGRSQYAADVRQGVLPDEARAIVRKIAYGELTVRQASVELGSRELAGDYGHPHQRAGSRLDRALQEEECAQDWLDAFIKQGHGEGWCESASLERISVRKRPWALKLVARCPVDEAMKRLGNVKKLKEVQTGHTSYSWRGCRVVFTTA